MARVIILQRVVPSYRLPIYRRLADELGWQVVFGSNVGGGYLDLASQEPFLHGVHFKRWLTTGLTHYAVPVREILQRFEPDAVVAEGALGMSSTWQLPVRRRFGGPKLLFWTIGYNPDRCRSQGLRGFRQWPYLLPYGSADALLLYGQDGVDFLRRFFPRKPMFVASNTIDIERLWQYRESAVPVQRLGHPELISVGRLTPSKDYVRLVRSFLLFRAKFPSAVLRILGDGPDRANIEAAAGNEIGRSVFLVGPSFHEADTARYMLAADMFVAAGRIGLSVNHALAYDLPVVAFGCGPPGPFHGTEIIYVIEGRTGFLVTDYSIEAFAQKLDALFSCGRDWKSELRDGIRDFVRDHLTIERMLDGFRAADAFIQR